MTAKAPTATANGTAAVFPVDSFREAAPHLRRPFTPEAVKFKVQATWPKDNPTGGLVVAYIDARLVVERLNLIVPHLWHDEYEVTPKGLMWCALTVDGITRRDVGMGEGKGLVSDALKRAAVKFGVGVSLYAVPKMIINVAQGHAQQKRGTLEMTDAGENRMRGIYRMWLDEHGAEAFGEALSHGDVEGAAGDPDEDHDPTEPEPPKAAPKATGWRAEPDPPKHLPPRSPDLVTAEDIKALQHAAKGLKAAQVKQAMLSCNVTPPDPFVPASCFLRVPRDKAGLLREALSSVDVPWAGELPAADPVAPEV